MIHCPACQVENDADSDNCIACGKGLYALTRGAVLSGRYEILDAIGKGGMGVVYKARDLDLDETIALKVMRGDVTGSSDGARRFRSEIKLARKVTHPNVCRIHDYSRQGHLTYIAMEFIAGTDLKQELRRRGPFPPEEALDLILQVARGLEAVHRQGVVHRDLKTPNIMRMADGTAKLMDFGIAKSFGDSATGVTATGLIVGTPEYMSPEQARAEAVDVRTDIYALGIVLFELFTGELPFHGETPLATLMNHMQQPPPLEGPRAARIPPQVIPVLRKALAKDRAERYASVQEMTVELERAHGALLTAVAARAEIAEAETLGGAVDLHVTTPMPTPVGRTLATPAPTPVPEARVTRAKTAPASSPLPRVTTPPATPAPRVMPPTPTPRAATPPAAPTPRPITPPVSRPAPTPAVAATPPRPAARVPTPLPAPVVSPPVPTIERAPTPLRHSGPPPRRVSWVVWAGGGAAAVVVVVGATILVGLLGARPAATPPTVQSPPPEVTISATPTATPPVPGPAATPRAESSVIVPAPVAKTPRDLALAKAASTAPLTLLQSPTPTPRPSPEPSQPPRPPTLALKPASAPAPAPRAATVSPSSGGGSSASPATSVATTPAPAAATVAAPESTGTVRIGVKPYAEVFVDGASAGTTPLGALTLPAGPHLFRFVHPDYQPLQRKLTIRSGEAARLAIDLTLDGIPK